MRPIVCTWPALSALGAGLVHLALVASVPPVAAGAFVVLGSAELVWAVAALAICRVSMPKVFLAVSLLPVLFMVAVLALSMAGGHGMPSESMGDMSASLLPASVAGPLLAACGLDLVVALGCAWTIRNRAVPSRADVDSARALVGLLLGAALVSGAVVPALGMTDVGRDAHVHMSM